MGNISYTVGGDSNLVSFRSAARVPITSLKASFLPKQDLHGYSKPWIGGTGKNLFNINASEQDANTVNTNVPNTEIRTFIPGTYNLCASWSNYRDPSRIISFSVNNNIISICSTTGYGIGYTIAVSENTQYAISATIEGNGGKINIAYYDASGNYISDSSSSDNNINNTIITTPANAVVAVLILRGNYADVTVNFSNVQFEKGATITSYEPYENICPIEGWNQCEICHTGKNLFGGEALKNKIANLMPNIFINSNDEIISYNNANAADHQGEILYNQFKPNTRYTFIVTYSKDVNRYIHLRFDYSDGTYSMMSRAKEITVTDKTTEVFVSTANKTVVSISRQADEYSTVNLYYNESGLFEGILTIDQFEPYQEQIIPITFPVLGKNKFNWNVEQSYSSPVGSDLNTLRSFTPNTYVIGMSVNNYYRDNYTNWVLEPSITNGTISFSSGNASGYGIGFPLDLIPGQTYFLSGTADNNGGAAALYYDEQGALLSSQVSKLNKTITIPNNTKTTVIVFYSTATQTSYNFSNIQLELGTEATTYEEYNPDNTVYGGYVDIAKGEIVATYAYHTLDGTEARWTVDNSSNYKRAFTDSVRLGKVAKAKGKLYGSYTNSQGLWRGWISSSGSSSSCHILFYIPSEIDTVDKWTAYLTEHPLDICYELNESIHYLLTKTQLQTLLDQNNIWSNTNGNTEVSYAIHDSAMIRSSKKQIIVNEPHIATASGSIATFNTDMIAPIKSAKVYFNPVQEGSGEPSPENVRNISGWTGLNISQYGNNLIDLTTVQYSKQSIISYNISNNTLTLTATSGGAYFGQYTAYYNVDQALIGKQMYFGVTSINLNTSNENHRATIVCEFRDKDNKKITDPTVISWANGSSSNTIARKLTIPENAVQAILMFRIAQNGSAYNLTAGDTVTFHNFYIRYPANIYEYNDVTKQIITLNWQDTLGTIYGGYVDLIKGELIETYTMKDLSTLTWALYTTNNLMYVPGYSSRSGLMLCNKLYAPGQVTSWNAQKHLSVFFLNNYSGIFLRYNTTNLSQTEYINDFKSFLNNEHPIFLFPKITPVVHQLTPTQLKTLKGTNNIWSNTNGNISVQYWRH